MPNYAASGLPRGLRSWCVWLLLIASGICTGTAVGAGFTHPILIASPFVVILFAGMAWAQLPKPGRAAILWMAAMAVAAIGIAVGDLLITRQMLIGPFLCLFGSAALAILAAILEELNR